MPSDAASAAGGTVEHSHAVAPGATTTDPAQRLPSARGGDLDVARHDSLARGGQPVEQRLRVVTDHGDEVITYGSDPSHRDPFWVSLPGSEGPPTRFHSLDDYAAWYSQQPGTHGATPHFETQPEPPAGAHPDPALEPAGGRKDTGSRVSVPVRRQPATGRPSRNRRERAVTAVREGRAVKAARSRSEQLERAGAGPAERVRVAESNERTTQQWLVETASRRAPLLPTAGRAGSCGRGRQDRQRSPAGGRRRFALEAEFVGHTRRRITRLDANIAG